MLQRSIVLALGSALLLQACASEQTSNPQTFEARHVPERKDDFAFENDQVAFRFYGPALAQSAEANGADCWLKRVDYPVINKWYEQHQQGQSYHEDNGEGYDPYHVGSSFGCGATSLWQPEQSDKLLQANVYQDYKIIEKSAERVVFELTFKWPEQNVTEVKRVTLEKGSQLYRADSTFTKNGKPLQAAIAVGVSTHDGNALASADSERALRQQPALCAAD